METDDGPLRIDGRVVVRLLVFTSERAASAFLRDVEAIPSWLEEGWLSEVMARGSTSLGHRWLTTEDEIRAEGIEEPPMGFPIPVTDATRFAVRHSARTGWVVVAELGPRLP